MTWCRIAETVELQEMVTSNILILIILIFILVNTHCHADHITGSGILKTMTKCHSMIGAKSGAKADILLNDGDEITYGEQVWRKGGYFIS